jgi:hypothetical protein
MFCMFSQLRKHLVYHMSSFLNVSTIFLETSLLFVDEHHPYFTPKKWQNKEKMSDIYLTHVCKLLQSIESTEKI